MSYTLFKWSIVSQSHSKVGLMDNDFREVAGILFFYAVVVIVDIYEWYEFSLSALCIAWLRLL